MKNLKDLLTTALGWGGLVLWFILSSSLTFAPIWMLDFPFWISFIAMAVYFFLPVLGSCMMFVLWMWSFASSLAQPLSLFTILYYVAAVIYLIGYLIPFIAMIATLIAPRPKHYFWDIAPIAYYKFLVYFGLIFSIFSTLGNTFSNYQNYNWFLWLLDFFSIGLLGFAWVDLKHKKWSGAVALCSLTLMDAIVSAVFSILLFITDADPVEMIVNATASLILCVLFWIYFCKRRPLFSPWYQAEDDVSYYDGSTDGSERDYDDPSPELQLDLDVPSSPPSGQSSDRYDSDMLSQGSAALMNKQKHRLSPITGLLTLACLSLLVVSACSILYGIKKGAECDALKTDIFSYEKRIENLQTKIEKLQKTNDSLVNKEKEINSEKEKLKKENFDLFDMWAEVNDDFTFYYYGIGLIVDGSSYYHSFDCPIFEEADEYWAHNIEFCQSIGYAECPVCFYGQ